MTTSLSFCLARRRRARFLHRFVFACLICVGGCGRFIVRRNYCGGKPRQRAEIWVSSQAPRKLGFLRGRGARGERVVGDKQPRSLRGAPAHGCAAGTGCFLWDRPWLPPSRCLGSGAGCPCPVLANPGFAGRVCSGGTIQVVRGRGRKGSSSESPATLPGGVGMLSGGIFSTKAPEKEPLPTCAKLCLHQAPPHAHMSPLGHFSPHKPGQGSPAVRALLLSAVTAPGGLVCQEGLFCWLQVEAGGVIASHTGCLHSKVPGLRLPSSDLFFHLGLSTPSPGGLRATSRTTLSPTSCLVQPPWNKTPLTFDCSCPHGSHSCDAAFVPSISPASLALHIPKKPPPPEGDFRVTLFFSP